MIQRRQLINEGGLLHFNSHPSSKNQPLTVSKQQFQAIYTKTSRQTGNSRATHPISRR
jgi:hypothetical protein